MCVHPHVQHLYSYYIYSCVCIHTFSIYISPLIFSFLAVCTGGQEYQTCGSPCPRTCDNYQIDLLCIQYCVQGCFCPGSTVLHEGECIPSDQCPGEGIYIYVPWYLLRFYEPIYMNVQKCNFLCSSSVNFQRF